MDQKCGASLFFKLIESVVKLQNCVISTAECKSECSRYYHYYP